MTRPALPIAILLASTLVAGPAAAQEMDHAMHSGHAIQQMPQARPASAPASAPEAAAPDGQSAEPTGTDQPPGSAEPPPVAHDRAADRYWDPAAMAAAAEAEMNPPRPVYAKLTFDLAEYQIRDGRDGYRWEAEGWLGDLNRLVLKSKGEGTLREGVDHAEFQAVYSKALDPWWNLQAGLRQDVGPAPVRTYAVLGVEGRAPYQFEVQAHAFLSDKGQLSGRIEASYDQRVTQRLILQPRGELDLSAQDMPAQHLGSGLNSAELGLRLRYEIRREFAPYLGVNWTWLTGKTADYARADGHDATERSLVVGLRTWF